MFLAELKSMRWESNAAVRKLLKSYSALCHKLFRLPALVEASEMTRANQKSKLSKNVDGSESEIRWVIERENDEGIEPKEEATHQFTNVATVDDFIESPSTATIAADETTVSLKTRGANSVAKLF